MPDSDAHVRRVAGEAGYVARKSNWRKNSCDNFGRRMLVDPTTGGSVLGFHYDASAEEIIEYCSEVE